MDSPIDLGGFWKKKFSFICICLAFFGSTLGLASEEGHSTTLGDCEAGIKNKSDPTDLTLFSTGSLLQSNREESQTESALAHQLNQAVNRIWKDKEEYKPRFSPQILQEIRKSLAVQKLKKNDQGQIINPNEYWYFPAGKLPGLKIQTWMDDSKNRPGLLVFPQLHLGSGGSKSIFLGVDFKTNRPLAISNTQVGAPEIANQNKFAQMAHVYPLQTRAFKARSSSKTLTIDKYYNKGTLADQLKFFREHPVEVLRIARQLFSQIIQLENLKIRHRDLKLNNIFLETQNQGCFQATIADFGLSEDDSSSEDTSSLSVSANVSEIAYIILQLLGVDTEKQPLLEEPALSLVNASDQLATGKIGIHQALNILEKLKPFEERACASLSSSVKSSIFALSIDGKSPSEDKSPSKNKEILVNPGQTQSSVRDLVKDLNHALSKIQAENNSNLATVLNERDIKEIRSNRQVQAILAGPDWKEGLKWVNFKHLLNNRFPKKQIHIKAWITPQKEVFFTLPDWSEKLSDERPYASKAKEILGFSSHGNEALVVQEKLFPAGNEVIYQNLVARKDPNHVPMLRQFRQPEWFPTWWNLKKTPVPKGAKSLNLLQEIGPELSTVDHIDVFPYSNIGPLSQNAQLLFENKTVGLSMMRQLLGQLQNLHKTQVSLLASDFKLDDIWLRNHRGCIQAAFKFFENTEKQVSTLEAEKEDRNQLREALREFFDRSSVHWMKEITKSSPPGSLNFVLSQLMEDPDHHESVFENGSWKEKNIPRTDLPNFQELIDSIDQSGFLPKIPCAPGVPLKMGQKEIRKKVLIPTLPETKRVSEDRARKYKCCSPRNVNKTISCELSYTLNRNPELTMKPGHVPLCKSQRLNTLWKPVP